VAIAIAAEHPNTCRLEIRGLLSQQDLAAAQQAAAAEIRRSGKIRLLVVLADFNGWDRGSAWDDLGFYIRHGDDIERIAIVGESRWRSEALMFAAADLRRAPVAFFGGSDIAAARDWLAQ